MAFILLFTTQLTVLNNYICALDTTFRILITWYKLHVMKIYHSSMEVYSGFIIPFYSEFLPYKHSQAGFELGILAWAIEWTMKKPPWPLDHHGRMECTTTTWKVEITFFYYLPGMCQLPNDRQTDRPNQFSYLSIWIDIKLVCIDSW